MRKSLSSRAYEFGFALALLPILTGALFALALPASAHAEACPNAASRSSLSASLPDCRVYEMVTPRQPEREHLQREGEGQHV